MTVWRVARYRFTAAVQPPLTPPEYAGSFLREQLFARPAAWLLERHPLWRERPSHVPQKVMALVDI